jgi:hypothetical protein
MLQYLRPFFAEESEFYFKVRNVVNKIMAKEPFTDEEHYLAQLDEPFIKAVLESAGEDVRRMVG